MPRASVRHGVGSEGYELDWQGFDILVVAAEAARMAINDVTTAAARIAREEHEWENRTGQTEAAVFQKDAEVEFFPIDDVSAPHVWGEWGVEDRPRFNKDGEEEDVTTKDVALFLEFGTVRQEARPWLYPAWDQTKVLLPGLLKLYYEELTKTTTPDIGNVGIAHNAGWRRYMDGFF